LHASTLKETNDRLPSIQQVYDVFTSQLGIRINQSSADCLKLNFQGNAHLDKNEVDRAIECYDKAIPLSHRGQEGVLRVMRSTAYLQRAYTHFMQFRELVEQAAQPLPDQAFLAFLQATHASSPFLVLPVLAHLSRAYQARDRLYRLTKFQFSLFEFAVHKACHDALTATHILPHFTKSWIRAGASWREGGRGGGREGGRVVGHGIR
jgi:tetratricopeptide (TPR) repeat protein